MLDDVKNNNSEDTKTNPQPQHVADAPCDCFECFLETTCEELN